MSIAIFLIMDDFGSGYSSLNTLVDVTVDVLKLDMHFVATAENNKRKASILKSVIRMVKELRLPVIAEGIETKEQADALEDLGCPMMQGYYFARPMSADDYLDLLKK